MWDAGLLAGAKDAYGLLDRVLDNGEWEYVEENRIAPSGRFTENAEVIIAAFKERNALSSERTGGLVGRVAHDSTHLGTAFEQGRNCGPTLLAGGECNEDSRHFVFKFLYFWAVVGVRGNRSGRF